MKSMRLFFVFLAAFLAATWCPAGLTAQVTLTESNWSIPTYKVQPAEKAPIFFNRESYQGASRYVYPLALNDIISSEKTNHHWKTLILENEYIKLVVTPEIGGKLYYAGDKTNHYNFIYKNDVVKPGNIGMTGAWVSGGIEWCVFHHHRASTFLPVDYSMAENTDGSKTIFVGETEPRHSMRWSIAVSAFPGKSYFEAAVSVHNPTPVAHSFLFWANVAAHTNEHYQTIFPPSVQVATYHAKNSFTRWPVSTEVYNGRDFTEGVDVSWWKNVQENNSFFAHDLQEDFMGGYDHGKACGTVHIGDHNIVKGAKLWEWGSGARGQATEARLTDGTGPYVEIMVGAYSDNQPDYSWIKPYETKTWKHYWYPVKDIGGFVNANLKGAVNLEERDDNKVFLGYYSTGKVDHARIILRLRDHVILDKTVGISPEQTFTEIVDIGSDFEFADLQTEMMDTETGQVLLSYRPQIRAGIKELPPAVEPPLPPGEIGTIEEVYLTGKRIEQFYNPRYSPLDYYHEALHRDLGDIRTNIALGNHYLKNGDYLAARTYLSRAIRRLTRDYTRPAGCEALYLQGLVLKELGLFDDAVDTLYRATWDYAFHAAAYFQLAQLSCMRHDYGRALDQINESLSTNTKNTRAIALKASIQRKTGDLEGAQSTLNDIAQSDPLNFRIGFESVLIVKASGNTLEAEKKMLSVLEKMRGFNQNFLNLAVDYIDDGFLQEAQEVLGLFNGKDPEITYYLGYIMDRLERPYEAEKLFAQAAEMSADYCFPFRLRTMNVLNTALKYHPGDAKAHYYMGNILYDKQPDSAIACWEASVKLNPRLAMALRNLGWGYSRHKKDLPTAISCYEKAISLDEEEAIYYYELDVLYEMANTPVSVRYALFRDKQEIVRKRDDAFERQLTVLTLAGQPERALECVEGETFSYREGNSRLRETLIDAHLTLGLKLLQQRKYQPALDHFLSAQIPDEEAGSTGHGNRMIQVWYCLGLTYDALGNQTIAKSFYEKAVHERPGGVSDLMDYYLGLCYRKLGKADMADEIHQAMISEGERQLQPASAPADDFFAKFGARDAENSRLSRIYSMIGLGYKGMGRTGPAKEMLQKAVDLKVSNLWANIELQSL